MTRPTIVAMLLTFAFIVTDVGSGSSRIGWKISPTVAAQTASPSKQAVVETTAGTFIIDVTSETAPNQAAYFMKTATEGGYDGTIFHRMIPRGMV